MPVTYTPLRYPGGKTAIYPMVSNIIQHNLLKGCKYAEPYAGGGGLALSLLFKGIAKEIHLNDLDRSIWAFWDSILNRTAEFIDKLERTSVTIDEWYLQREIQNNKNSADILDLGFSSFFLNRTNRSGIILKAGVIGGLQQKGNYKIDCRFNKNNLKEKILKIKQYRDKIKLYNQDAVDFIRDIDEEPEGDFFIYIDPPYFEKGSSLYANFYDDNDHACLCDFISSIKTSWILTYDDAEKIKKLYEKNKIYKYYLNYSVARKRLGAELLICSDNINIPQNYVQEEIVKKFKTPL